jgi:hypothetical protein
MRLKPPAAALAAAVFLATVLGPAPALAQKESENYGRYTVVNGVVSTTPGTAEQRVTLLLDTQVGRTWMITVGPEGIHWVRLQFKILTKVPESMMVRPGPVTPFPLSK